MPRTLEIDVPGTSTDAFLEEVQRMDGLLGLRVHRGVSVQPPGDHVVLQVTNEAMPGFMHALDRHGIISTSAGALTGAAPTALVSLSHADEIARDSSEAPWEEIDLMIGRESNMTINALGIMFAAGFIAVLGVTTNAIHIVIGGMLVAPGFQPITRIPLGLVTQSRTWQRGLVDTLKGYLVLVIGAMVAAALLPALGIPTPLGQSTYLESGELVRYWTSISVTSVLISLAASLAGALLLASHRSVLATGVMVALALVPAASLTGMFAVTGDWSLCGKAALRWIIDVGLVIGATGAVFAWKRVAVHKRPMRI